MSKKTVAALAAAPLLLTAAANADLLGVAASHAYVDIEGYGPARVIRLYACMTDPDDRLVGVYGHYLIPMTITAGDTPIYQDEAGGNGAPTTALYPFICGLRYDTFVDIGRVAGDTGLGVILSPEFAIGNTALSTSNGGWWRIPYDPRTRAGADLKVFFGQFTVPADAPLLTGIANFSVRRAGNPDPHGGIIYSGVEFSEEGAVPIPTTADVDGNQDIEIDDLIATIVNWGDCDPCPGDCDDCYCYSDVNEDGQVDGSDMFQVLSEWGSL